MKKNNIKESGFEYSVELSEMDDLNPMINPKGIEVKDKIVLNYAKSTDRYYISCYYLNPLDSYGATWDMTDSGCFSLTKDELSELISELQLLKDQGE